MNEQVAFQKLLRKKLLELKLRNPQISVRAFASRLGLQASATNEILKGERRVSRKLAERVAAKLNLDPTERNDLFKTFPDRRRNKKSVAGGALLVGDGASAAVSAEGADDGDANPDSLAYDVLKMSADQFEAISNWTHFAILSLVKLKSFESNTEWIARRLGMTPKQAHDAIERLLRLNFLKRDEDGKLVRTYARFNTTDDILSSAIQKSHLADMELARASLLNDPLEIRDFVSITMPASPALIPKAKEILRRAQDEMTELLESGEPTEVYRLSTYLYPLTRSKNQTQNPIQKKKE